MQRWQGRVAVVTGASSGIGSVIAKDLVHNGIIVVGIARREHRLQEVKMSLPENLQGNFYPYRCDVSKEDEVKTAFEWVKNNLKGADILINNAGVYKPVLLSTEENTELMKSVIEINTMGMIYCIREMYRSMKARNVDDGHIVCMNSILGLQIPTFDPAFKGPVCYGTYPASKFAMTALCEVYRQEFLSFKSKIKITNISPGMVDTEIVAPEYKAAANGAILRCEDVSEAVLYTLGTHPNVQVREITIAPLGSTF